MGRHVGSLKPGALYITISVPHPETHAPGPKIVANFAASLPADFDPLSYETACADGCGVEEFDWGLYLHRGPGDGIWYTLRRRRGSSDGPSDLPVFTYHRREVRQSPRLARHVAGLVRVLVAPGERAAAHELAAYLNWWTADTAAGATRSFLWAMSAYGRARRHLAWKADCAATAALLLAKGFEVRDFLCEALGFAYGEVLYGLAGQLPRPVMASDYGVEFPSWMQQQQDGMETEEKQVEERPCVQEVLPHGADMNVMLLENLQQVVKDAFMDSSVSLDVSG